MTLCLCLSLSGKAFAAEGEKAFEYSFGRELQTVPAVDNDGTIFVGGKGAAGALTPAGMEKWKIELSAGSQADVSGITISDDRIYVTSTQGLYSCLLYTSPSPRDGLLSRMPSSA